MSNWTSTISARHGTHSPRGGDVRTSAPLDAKIATAVVNLAIGVAAGTLVGGVAARSAAPYDRISRH